MTSFDKSAVDVAQLSVGELNRVTKNLLGEVPEKSWKLSNGACAANYGVEFFDKMRAVIKAVVGDDSESLAANQLSVLNSLNGSRVSPDLLCDRSVSCVTTDGAKACAVAMEFVDGDAANVLVRDKGFEPVMCYGAVGTALGSLHALKRPTSRIRNDLGHDRYLETFIRLPQELEASVTQLLSSSPESHTVAFGHWLLTDSRLPSARKALGRQDLPRGLLHGDPYADNVVLQIVDGAVRRATLVDWEDVAVGPLAYDLASALVACAFNFHTKEDTAIFDKHVAKALIDNYAKCRPSFSKLEALALTDLMLANVLACATYRWHHFNVVAPDSSPDAKASYEEMLAIASAIEAKAGTKVTDLALAAVAS